MTVKVHVVRTITVSVPRDSGTSEILAAARAQLQVCVRVCISVCVSVCNVSGVFVCLIVCLCVCLRF